MSESMWLFYEKWTETDEYRQQSAVENASKINCKNKSIKSISEEQYEDIEDNILSLANEAEQSGFSNGFRFGVLFMNEILKGGALT